MSTITTTCVHCGKVLQLEPQFLDKNLRCPSCQEVFRVSNISPTSSTEDAEQLAAIATRSDPTSAAMDRADAANRSLASDADSESAGDSGTGVFAASLRAIGRYQVKRELGRGAFGVVYRADDPVLKREVAIKLQNRAGGERDHAAMLAEARAAARLRHPNIVAVYEADTYEGRPFVVSELIPGRTLAERMAEGEIDQREAAALVRDLARGLAHAHEQGLVHRDVKPHNILLGADGRPQLTDFGLAVDRRDEDQAREQAYSRSGTLAYLAPEQAGIGGVSVGPAADQYALGATLFEMLTGERPHQGSTLEILLALEAPQPPRAKERTPRVAVDLDAICFKAMAHDAWQRYDSCAELADDLDRFLTGDLIRGRRIGLIERARHFSKRNPRIASWTLATVATFLLLFTLSTVFAVRGQILARNMSRNGQQASGTTFVPVDRPRLMGGPGGMDDWDLDLSGDDTAPFEDESDDLTGIEQARWISYSRKLNKAARSVDRSETQLSHKLLDELPPRYRHWEHKYLANATSPPIHEWKRIRQSDGSVEVLALPMGLRVALVERPYPVPVPADTLANRSAPSTTQLPVTIHDLTTGESLFHATIVTKSSEAYDVRLCPLHTRPIIAFTDGAEIRFWNYEDSTELPPLATATSRLEFLTVSPDDRWLAAYNQEAKAVQFWNWERRELIQSVPAPLQPILFTPDAGWALFHTADGEVVKYSPSTMTASVMMTLPEETSMVAVSLAMNEVVLLDARGEMRLQPVFPGVPNQVIARNVSSTRWDIRHYPPELISQVSSGETFMVARRGDQIQIVQGDTVYPVALPTETSQVQGISVHGAGELLVALVGNHEEDHQRVLVWDVSQILHRTGIAVPQESAVASLASSPDQRYLAVGLSNGKLALWNQEMQFPEWSTYTQSSAPATPMEAEIDTLPHTGSAMDAFAPALQAVAYHPSGNLIAAGGQRGTITFWSPNGGDQMGAWPSINRPVHALAYSPDGRFLAAGLSSHANSADSEPADLIVFASDDGSVVHRWQAHRSRVNSVAFHPSGDFVYSSGDDGQVIQWQLGSNRPASAHSCSFGIPSELRVSPDGHSLVFVATDTNSTDFETVTMESTYTVMKPVFETKTREVNLEICSPVTKVQKTVVHSEGILDSVESLVTEYVTKFETATETYTVCHLVPEVRTMTSAKVVPRQYDGSSIRGMNGSVRPCVVMLDASDLSERGTWVPEGGRIPTSPAFSADGRRLFVSTDHGVSVVHPRYLLELVELRPGRGSSDHVNFGSAFAFPFSTLAFSPRHGQLCVAAGQDLYWLRDRAEPNAGYWTALIGRIEAKQQRFHEISAAESTREFDGMAPWISLASTGPFDLPAADPNHGILLADTTPTRALADVGPEEESVDLLTLNLDYSGPTELPKSIQPRGLVTAPGARHRLEVGGHWGVFSTRFRLADDHHGAMVFVIVGDGRTLYRSSIRRDHQLHGIRVDVRGIQVLELVAERADRGQDPALGVWLSPNLSQKVEATYAVEFDELRIEGTELDLCEIKLTADGLELTRLHFTEPTLLLNGIPWEPKSEPRLPNTGRTQFFSPGADFQRARIHAHGIHPQANLIHRYEEDGVRIQFSYPPVGSTEFGLVVQVPRRLEGESPGNVEPNWRAPWKVGGYAFQPAEHGTAPADVPPKGSRAFAVDDLDEIEWSWPSGRSPLRNTPEQHYVLIGQRAFQSEGGFYRIEAIGDDGIRVKVNDRVVIDHWKPGPVLQHAAMVRLGPGTHRVRFEQLKPRGASRLGVIVRTMESKPFRRKDPPIVPVPIQPEEARSKAGVPTLR